MFLKKIIVFVFQVVISRSKQTQPHVNIALDTHPVTSAVVINETSKQNEYVLVSTAKKVKFTIQDLFLRIIPSYAALHTEQHLNN